MATKIVSLPLFDEVDYKYSITLEGEYYSFRFIYNEYMEMYTLQISDVKNGVLISGVGVVANYPMLADYVIGNLSGALLMSPKSDKDIEFYKLYPSNLSEYYILSYIYDDSNQQEV